MKSYCSIFFAAVFFCLFFTPSRSQELIKIIQLDSIVIEAVKGGFSVEDFIRLVRSDTSFYKGFKNLRYYPYSFKGDLTVFSKGEKEKAHLLRLAKQEVSGGKKWINITNETVTGKIYGRNGEFKYYTAELFDYLFYPRDTAIASNIIRRDGNEKPQTKNERYSDKLKTLIFNPGSEVSGVPLAGNKLAIFDEDMIEYYDYKISTVTYKDSISCYVFTCKMKPDLSVWKQDKVVIRELVSYFDRKTFHIVFRSYDLSYSSLLFDFDVKMNVCLQWISNALVPENISYSGFWDVPMKSPETVNFHLGFYEYKIE